MTRVWWLLAGLVIIQLTRPDGKPVWVVSSQIVSVEPIDGEAAADARTHLRTGSGDRYVREPADQVLKKIRDAK